MKPTTKSFKENVRVALTDAQLQRALAGLPTGLVANRAAARARLPEFEDLREICRDIKDHTLAHLDLYLEEYERNATAAGAKVHWAATAAEAREVILKICREVNAKIVTKGKSMITEEIGLNAELQAAGI
ncbi:MAG TPA: LUD domain-containing protein, partial [Hyphomicrobiaceae bacterium]|nr:LUD domain-containing protein [Hyphomicrobiaceae bacterium]